MNGSWLGLLGLLFVFAFGEVFGADPNPVRLFVKEVPLKVLGKDVSVIAKFDGYRGRYLLHCHNLEHEDHSMMARFDVV